MPDEKRSRPVGTRAAATNTITYAESKPFPRPWRDQVDWANPMHTYAAGVEDGRQMEREQDALEAEAVHRPAVRNAVRLVAVAAAREPKVTTTSYTGGPVPTWSGPYDLTALTEAAERALRLARDRPVWTDYREVHRDVTPEVWRSVWNSLCDRTRARHADLDPYRLEFRR